ncbi:ABC transporter substrate-binding protein [Paenibacillus xylaniclasticus]|uniref:ABC transporter substrate-binding protein n=1 Tax=Paenibacillus xylaniclasticus TaxID=588083 RepID=UPI000FD98E5B|nr:MULTISPECIES: ABC transporter substrate-binding protein [Paenibacillus]GFN32941.1 ABC transporter substrate-binding protein [Paenibacillus curdlanolyticus]
MQKSYKIVLAFLMSTLIAGLLASCSSSGSSSGEEDKVLQYQGSPGLVNFPELAADLGYLGDLKLEKVSNTVGGPESIQLTATGEIDFGTAFNGATIKAVSKNVKIISVVGSYGSDENTYMGAYVLEESPIREPRDFIGKKVGMNILGAHAEFLVKDYLRQGGLTEKEISEVILMTIPSGSAEQTLRNKQLDIIITSGVARDRAVERGGLVELFKDIDVFGGEFTAGDYFFTEKYIARNPTTVKTFTEGVAKAIEWARNTPREEVIARFEKIVSSREGNEPTENLKYWKSTGIATTGGVIQDKNFSIWIDWLEKNGELKPGEVKLEDLYTNEFNPYAQAQ